jgi:hypothetical protein
LTFAVTEGKKKHAGSCLESSKEGSGDFINGFGAKRTISSIKTRGDKMKRILGGFFVCFALFGLGTAHATTSDVGTPFAGNSWDQAWYENGVGNNNQTQPITQIQMEWVSGSQFDGSTPGIFAFSNTTWSQTFDNGTRLIADGNSFYPQNLYFTTAFQDPEVNTTFYYQGYNGNILVDSCEVTWNGTSWTVTNVSYTPGFLDPAPTPEPSTLLLVGPGLVGLAASRKRSRKA